MGDRHDFGDLPAIGARREPYPGKANLQIGELRDAEDANGEIGVPGEAKPPGARLGSIG
jgi:hypothetical protein